MSKFLERIEALKTCGMARLPVPSRPFKLAGLLQLLGIAKDTRLALAPLRLNAAYRGPCMTVRRTSDSKVAEIGFRPNVAYDAPRNLLFNGQMLDNNGDGVADGWATTSIPAWAALSASNGKQRITITNAGATSFVAVNNKCMTRPVSVGDVIRMSVTAEKSGSISPYLTIHTLNVSDGIVEAVDVPISANGVYSATLTVSNSAPVVFRAYLQCAGTAIGASGYVDFSIAVATVNQSLPASFIDCNGAPAGAAPGTPKYDRFANGLYNCLSNGDGRYGLAGLSCSAGTLVRIPGGVRHTADATSAAQTIQLNGNTPLLPCPIGGKYSVKLTVNAPSGLPSLGVVTYNGTTWKATSLVALVTPGQDTTIIVDLPVQTDVGASNALRVYLQGTWPDAATANGKVLDVKNVSLIYRGESSSRPYYNTPVADLFNTVLAPYTNAAGVVHPFGTMPGEMDLDQLMAFVGSSSGYVTRWFDQQTANKVTLTNVYGRYGNFEKDTNGDGLADGWGSMGTFSAKSVSTNKQRFTASAQYAGFMRTVHPINSVGDVIYSCAYVTASSAVISFAVANGGNWVSTPMTHPGSGRVFMSLRHVAAAGQTAIDTYISDSAASGWTEVITELFHLFNLTTIFGAGYEPTKAWLDREIKAMLDTTGYVDTAELVRRNDAQQDTAGYQPRIVNAGVPDFCLMPYFDGTDDRMSIPNASSLDITTAPLMLWGRGVNQGLTGYLASRFGASSAEPQYGWYHDSSNAQLQIAGTATPSGAGTMPNNANNTGASVWDGTTVTPVANKTRRTSVSFAGLPGGRTNTFIGARSNAADGSAVAVMWKGNIGMVELATVNPTQAQLDRLG